MTLQDSQTLVRRFIDAYNHGDHQTLREVASPDFICHMGGQEPIVGLAATLAADTHLRGAFSGIRWTIADIFAEGDRVAVRRSWSLTHSGPYQGMPASGRTLTGTSIDIYAVRDGMLVEQWTEFDNLSFMQQLGALSAPAPVQGI